jgi:hypothetical protein
MATIATTTLLTWCGISTARNCNRIIADMNSAPEGLDHLNDESTEGLMSMYRDYTKRTVADGKIIFTRIQQRRIIALKDWVKDRFRLEEDATFGDGTTRQDFIEALDAATQRKKSRTNQRKTGEALVTTVFQVKLETATQWDRWIIELESNLKMIIGANGIALSYVIRQDDTPDLSEQDTWDMKAMLGAPHTGTKFNQDKLTVHNIILRNVAEGSDAFTYMKPHIRKDNGRADIKALRERYENASMQEQYINEAKKTIASITYRNERAMKFEKFVAQFVKAIDELEKRGRGLHNPDIVDLIWQKVKNPDLSQYVVALKVQYQRVPRDYQQVLQDIASQIPTLSTAPFRQTSEVTSKYKTGDDSQCPDSGAHDAEGNLFTGTYPFKKWIDDSVKPYWKEIRAALKANTNKHPSKKAKGNDGKKRSIASLESQISEMASKQVKLEAHIASLNTNGASNNEDNPTTSIVKWSGAGAGDAFGGRAERYVQKNS